LQWFENLCPLLRVQPYPRVPEGNSQPIGHAFQAYRKCPALRHGSYRVIAEIPEHLLDLVRIHTRHGLFPVERSHNLQFLRCAGFSFQQRQRFVQQRPHIRFLKYERLLARKIQEIRNDLIQSLRFPAYDIHQVLFVFFQRHQPRQLLYRTRHGCQRLPDFVRDCSREPPNRRHPFFCSHFLLEVPEFRQVLKIENESAAPGVSRPQRRHRNSQVAPLPPGMRTSISRRKDNFSGASRSRAARIPRSLRANLAREAPRRSDPESPRPSDSAAPPALPYRWSPARLAWSG